VILAILCGVVLGTFWGFLNGWTISKLKLPDVIVTVGIGSVAWGIAYLWTDNFTGNWLYTNFLTSGVLELNDGKWFHIPYPILLTASLYLIAYLFLHRSTYGRGFFSTGDNLTGAIFSGVQVKYFITVAFMICAGTASLATIMFASAQGQAGIKSGVGLMMPAYAAVYLGIAIFKRGTVYGTFLGSLLLIVMLNGFTLLSVPFYASDLITSVTLIFALALSNEMIFKKFARKKSSTSPASIEKEVAS